MRYSSDGGSTWTATQQQYAAGEADSAGDNGDGPYVGAFRAVQVEEYSSDGGLTWTANLIGGPRGLHQQYTAGEADSAGDNGDGPTAGTFRYRSSATGVYSNDGGSTWTASAIQYTAGEADSAGDNGDGPTAGMFRYRYTDPVYSSDGGSTWTATQQQYAAGEADSAGDNGDGPTAGTFRSQDAVRATYWCLHPPDHPHGWTTGWYIYTAVSLNARGLTATLLTPPACFDPSVSHPPPPSLPPPPLPPPPLPPPPPPDDGTTEPDDGAAEPEVPPEFTDVDEDSVHAQSIEEVAMLGITSGTSERMFSPSEPVTRAQMATFLARTWEAAGRECSTAAASAFFDDVAADSTHAAGIGCVAALGITSGTSERMFSPSEPVTRAQMATFLARTWEAAGRECSTAAASAFFDDVAADSTHAAGIGCVAALEITRGTAAGTFSPSDTVTRAQMATFLARFHAALTDTT